MSYTIRITRSGGLTKEDWDRVVSARTDVRLLRSRPVHTNPTTGEIIALGWMPGDAEVLFGTEWRPCFRWREAAPADGQPAEVAFDAPKDLDQPTCQVRMIAIELAHPLNARLVGEEDEEYA